MKKATRKSVKPTMSSEEEYELHDQHDASYHRQMKSAKVNEETSVMKDVVSKLLEYSGSQFQDKMANQDLNTERDEEQSIENENQSIGGIGGTGVRSMFARIGANAASSLSSIETQRMPDTSDDTALTDEKKENSKRSSGKTVSPSGANESMFHVASVLREDDEDENYSYDEINQDKDPDAAGGPYSEDDIKVTKDPRDAAPGMDPVADPPTQQAKQVTTGMSYKAPAAAGTMQTMLPGGEHDAIQKQYPDLIENLLGCGRDMKGGFLADPKDKKKAMAAMALMSSLDKKLKEDKKTRLKKILNTTKPPAIPGSEGY